MISINRNRCEDGELIQPSKRWFRQAADATLQAEADKGSHDFNAKIYGNRSVRRALEKLFRGKCAYCETSLVRQDWDVDHYRPKKRVHGVPSHPGYYWLGYEWRNLFPSCKLCNQKRKDVSTWDDPTEGPGGGKADHFPLRNNNERVDRPDVDIAIEEPLLINPCDDNPRQHITFSPLGHAIGLDDKGIRSTELYHLNAKRLGGWVCAE